MSEIESSDSSKPSPSYKQEFEKGRQLFKNSLDEYEKSKEPHQKSEFKKVMEKSLNIMNQSAKSGLGENVQKKEEKLEMDYHTFLNHECQATRQQLENDLNDLEASE